MSIATLARKIGGRPRKPDLAPQILAEVPAAEARLADLRGRYPAAALAARGGDVESVEACAAIEREMAEIEAGLPRLRAAAEAAAELDAKRERQRRQRLLEIQIGRLRDTLDEVDAAAEGLEGAIAAMIVEWRRLIDAREAARRAMPPGIDWVSSRFDDLRTRVMEQLVLADRDMFRSHDPATVARRWPVHIAGAAMVAATTNTTLESLGSHSRRNSEHIVKVARECGRQLLEQPEAAAARPAIDTPTFSLPRFDGAVAVIATSDLVARDANAGQAEPQPAVAADAGVDRDLPARLALLDDIQARLVARRERERLSAPTGDDR